MVVLVTGGAGYIGSEVVRSLVAEGFKPVVLDNLSTGFKESLPKQVPFVAGDIRDIAAVRQIFSMYKIHIVIHLAAKIVVEESLRQPLDYYDHNVGGLRTVLQVCREFSVDKFIFSSSGTIYGNSNLKLTQKNSEDDQLSPLSPYGYSKLIGEQMVKDMSAAYGLNFISLRYFNVGGAAVDGSNGQLRVNPTHIIHVASQAALSEKKEVTIFGDDYDTADGTCIRDYIHVSDIADIHVQAIKYLTQQSQSHILNCGYGKGYSVKEVVETFKKVNQVNLQVKYGPRRMGDPAILVSDTSRLQSLFKWQPKYDELGLICQTAYLWQAKVLNRNLF